MTDQQAHNNPAPMNANTGHASGTAAPAQRPASPAEAAKATEKTADKPTEKHSADEKPATEQTTVRRGDDPSADKKADRDAKKQAAKTAKEMAAADKEAESGERPSAHSLSAMGGNPQGDGHTATRTWAHNLCGTEIEVPADQSHPAESKCFGCRLDVDENGWIPRGGAIGGQVV